MCSKDSECADAGLNGRCVEMGGGVAYCGCTYDDCVHDSDCSPGKTCACHGSPYEGQLGNSCVPGNCRIDSDCGVGGYCSPTYSPNGCGGLGGYYCHTTADQCVNDSDCADGGFAVCAYVAMLGHWACQPEVACALR
jgi:hypothetical protein